MWKCIYYRINISSVCILYKSISSIIESKSFKVAQDITDNAFMVGAHHDLSDEQINFLCQSLRELALNKWH